MRFLISAGPTHEFIDDVRYLSNPSTGALGIAVSEAARDSGHQVTLVLGPTHLLDPNGIHLIRVESALEMHNAMMGALPGTDAVVMTAAVSDYRPEARVMGKIKKGADRLDLRLVRNPDILKEIGSHPGDRILVGFALEQAELETARSNARTKLQEKSLDLVILNRRGSFGDGPMEDARALTADREEALGGPDKVTLARWIVRFCEQLRPSDRSPTH